MDNNSLSHTMHFAPFGGRKCVLERPPAFSCFPYIIGC